jgi:hypothetical protein
MFDSVILVCSDVADTGESSQAIFTTVTTDIVPICWAIKTSRNFIISLMMYKLLWQLETSRSLRDEEQQ